MKLRGRPAEASAQLVRRQRLADRLAQEPLV